ncbi:MAG: hypothetical protein ACK56W_16625 [Pirellula sp.]|jgi:hypothetical protein|nr:hypothetical protein [Pirellula sp.]
MSLKMKIQLTPDLTKSLEQRGTTEPNLFEARGSARFRCNATATAKLMASKMHIPNQDEDSLVIVKDLSRSGVGFISHQQWFPSQVIELTLATGKIHGRVARARRIAASCYEIGIEIAKFEQNAASA